MKYSAALLLLAISIAANALQQPDFVQLYAKWDSAAASGRFDEISKMLLPGAAVQVGSSRMLFAEMLVQAAKFFQTITGATQKTTITSVNISGTEALLSRTTESSVTISGQTRQGFDLAEDTWTKTEDGWRLKLSKVISSRELTPPTPPDKAQGVASELRQHATAFSTNAASSLDDLDRVGEAIGDARVVGLGEATHGTREIQIAKERIIHYLVTRKGFTVLPRGFANGASSRRNRLAGNEPENSQPAPRLSGRNDGRQRAVAARRGSRRRKGNRLGSQLSRRL